MDKSPEAFRTISEVAEELDLPQHVLRFWETRFPQIKPLKRGGGRRYYRPEDVELLRADQAACSTAKATRSRACRSCLKEQGAAAMARGVLGEREADSRARAKRQRRGATSLCAPRTAAEARRCRDPARRARRSARSRSGCSPRRAPVEAREMRASQGPRQDCQPRRLAYKRSRRSVAQPG